MSAQLEGVFDPSQYAPTMGGGQSLPVSDKKGHLVVITESEMKPTSSGSGTMLALTLHIQDGHHLGTEGNWNLNLGNPNATTVRIAQQELACICHAVGHVGALQNTEVLHNKPFRIVVGQQKKNPEYTEVNNVLRADGSKLTDPPGSATAPTIAPPPQQPPATPTGFPTTNAVQPTQTPQPPVQPPQQQQWTPPQPPQPQQQAPPAQPPGQPMPWNQQGT